MCGMAEFTPPHAGPLPLHRAWPGSITSSRGATNSSGASIRTTSASPLAGRRASLIDAAAARAAGGDAASSDRLGGAAARTRRPTRAADVTALQGAGARSGPSAPSSRAIPTAASLATLPARTRWPTASARAFSSWYELFPRSAPHEPGRTAPSATSRRGCRYIAAHGLRRAVLPADPSDRPRQPQGHEQRARGRARRRRQPLGHRRRRRRPQGHPARARHARGFPRAGRQGARARHRDRDGHRLPVRARPSLREGSIRSGSAWRPDGSVQYAENPPKKYQDIYPFDFESDGLARPVERTQERVRPLDRAGRDGSSASTTRTPRRSRSGNG